MPDREGISDGAEVGSRVGLFDGVDTGLSVDLFAVGRLETEGGAEPSKVGVPDREGLSDGLRVGASVSITTSSSSNPPCSTVASDNPSHSAPHSSALVCS